MINQMVADYGLIGTFVIFYVPLAALVIAYVIGREGRF